MNKMPSPKWAGSTPICRCRVLYLGSAVPHITKDGLQGIQEPLKELYPEQGALGAKGIDSWLSVWSNGLLLENVDENHKKVTRFFPIETLHYCAAVRYVLVPEKSSISSSAQPRFLPLDSPFARAPNPNHPPLFACILRRTTGIKVLECHTFICKREMAANALVRCCFHAYADSAYAKQIDNGNNVYGTLNNNSKLNNSTQSIEKVEGWKVGRGSTLTLDSRTSPTNGNSGTNGVTSNSVDDISIYNGDENHKIWATSPSPEDNMYGEVSATMRSSKSRPRQIMTSPPPPPPPAPKEDKSSKKPKDKSKKRNSRTPEGFAVMNGSLLRPASCMPPQGALIPVHPNPYVYGTLIRPGPRMMPSYQPALYPPRQRI